eukprot:1160526-Pelagomonas_calceolata.AAC.1
MLLHYISITWKLICAIIPPADYAQSYPTFVGSLVVLVGIIYLTKESLFIEEAIELLFSTIRACYRIGSQKVIVGKESAIDLVFDPDT